MGLVPFLAAVVAAVDVPGVGGLGELKEQGIKVPEQIRLISLTGHIIGGMLETTMTSMEMPAHEMGLKAALMTIRDIESPTEPKTPPQHLVFTSSLVERESS
ncbi:hypothetical protein CG709_17855 [Lachnotalea glycerini]|nr:hypothetical protein CG709_17855 [Lachnotalea glycerini]